MILSDNIILILSPEPWGTNWLSKHHYANELASLGNDVFFLNPPVTSIIPGKITVEEAQCKLHIVNYSIHPGVNVLPAKIRRWYHHSLARKILKMLPINRPDIVWSFDPFVFQELDVFEAPIKIYHPVDVHKARLEYKILETADIIFSPSEHILSRFPNIQTPKFKIFHGVSSHFFNGHKEIETELPGPKSNLKLCYVGNLQSPLIDFVTLEKLVADHPEISFYFIGPDASSNLSSRGMNFENLDRIKNSSNTYFIGEMDSRNLSSYLKEFDVFLILYKGDEYPDLLTNSHKMLEYLSTGKPVVASYTREYEGSDLIEMVRNNNDIPILFNSVINNFSDYNSPEKKKARRNFARANSYTAQIHRIEDILTEYGY